MLTLNNGAVNTMYANRKFELADFPRASAIASNYASFKIAKITMRFFPQTDTFAAAQGVPTFYSMLDKSGAIPSNITLENLKQMGAKGRRFDDKTITVSWRPSVLVSALQDTGAPGTIGSAQYKLSPTLSTSAVAYNPGLPWSPSTIDHLGIFWYVDQLNPVGENQYKVEVEAQFYFMRPLVKATGAAEAVELKIAQ